MSTEPGDQELVWYFDRLFGAPPQEVSPLLLPPLCPRCAMPGMASARVAFFGLSIRDVASAYRESRGLYVASGVLGGGAELTDKLLGGVPGFLVGQLGKVLASPLNARAQAVDPDLDVWQLTLWFCQKCGKRYRFLERSMRGLLWIGIALLLLSVVALPWLLDYSERLALAALLALPCSLVVFGFSRSMRRAIASHCGMAMHFDGPTHSLRVRFLHPHVHEAMARAQRGRENE